jgi:hypothetical protein
VKADSKQAKALNMAAADPLLLRRTDAEAFIRIYAKAFREAEDGITPASRAASHSATASTFTVNLPELRQRARRDRVEQRGW